MTFLTVARSATVAAGLLLTGGFVLSAFAADTSSSLGTAYAQNDRRGGGQGDKSDDNKRKGGTPAVPSQPGNRGQGPAQAQPAQRQPDRGADRGNQRPDRVVRQKPQQPARQPEARNATPKAERPVVRTDNRGNGRPATRDNAQRNDRPATRDAERNDRPVDRTGPGRNANPPVQRDRARYQDYRHNYTATRRFQVDVYRWNSGRSYRRYAYGESLPNYYFSRNYWLADFLMYGLFAPPPGLIWVRYGPDALLIDEETGEIYQVRYNIFYS